MSHWKLIVLSLVVTTNLSSLSGAQMAFTEIDRAEHDGQVELHAFRGGYADLRQKFADHQIDDSDDIYAFDVEKNGDNVQAVPRPGKVSQFKAWAANNINHLRNTFCLIRFVFSTGATGWALYRFYDFTDLHPSSIITGATVAGIGSLLLMAYTLKVDQWLLKSKTLMGQFFRYTFLSIAYIAVIKTGYLTAEIIQSGASIVDSKLVAAELGATAKSLVGSTAQMLFSFWNAYRKENRDAEIAASNIDADQKELEHRLQRVISKSNSLFNSVANNTLTQLMNVTSNPILDSVGYLITATGGALFLKERTKRNTRLNSCAHALGGV